MIGKILATLLVALSYQLALANELQGRVVGVSDGDTITVLDAKNHQHKVRLAGIDAPEKSQAFGQTSKKHLSEVVFGETVVVEWQKLDRYGRVVGKVLLEGFDVCLEQIRKGMAWHYKKYSSDQQLAAAEQSIRDHKIGLWSATNRIPPWDFRKGIEENAVVAVPAPIPFAPITQPSDQSSITVYVTKTGTHYHRGGCRSLSQSHIPSSLDRARAGYSRCSVCNPPYI